MSNGKGHAPRPFSIDQQTYRANWDRIFGTTPVDHDTCAYSGLLSTSSYESGVNDHAKHLTDL
jgi:hypothetical protein